MCDYYGVTSSAVRNEIDQIRDKEKEYKTYLCRKSGICLKLRKSIRILINKASN